MILDLNLLLINIILHSSLDFTLLVCDELSVHVLKLVVSKVRLNLSEFNRTRLVVSYIWSVFKLVGLEWINSHEDDLFVLWIVHVTNPLDSLLVHGESEFLVSKVLLARFLNILVLNQLVLSILHAPHTKTGVVMIVSHTSATLSLLLNSVSLGKNKFGFQEIMDTLYSLLLKLAFGLSAELL